MRLQPVVLAAPAAAPSHGLVPLFAAALFVSAFQLFLIEPLIGRIVLPVLGGAPAVWNTCMVFFQAMLLAGYAYAHVSTTWLGHRRQVAAQCVLVLLPLALLPIRDSAPAPPVGDNPVGWLLMLLFASVGLPFFVLSTSTTVLQRWFSTTADPRARDPYFLYAASNLGSLVALLAYPTVIEPLLPLREQTRLWTLGYVAFGLLTFACALRVYRSTVALPETAGTDGDPAGTAGAHDRGPQTVRWTDAAAWVFLSAVPSSLMLGVTSYLSTDVASVPLLWVVPLSLYLLTFVVAFSRVSPVATALADRLLPTLVLPLVLLMAGHFATRVPLVAPLHLLAFAAAALFCHGELARRRPAAERLTAYYLWIAVGGVAGGIFNALVAPAVFTGVAEYPIAIALACAARGLRPRARTSAGGLARTLAPAAVAGALAIAVVLWANRNQPDPRALAALLGLPVFVMLTQSRRPLTFAGAVALTLLAGAAHRSPYGPVLHAERTFFGVSRVREDEQAGLRFLMHGTTLHGMQRLDPARRRDALGYYHAAGPFGELSTALPAAWRPRVAVVGLGAGALAAYARPDQQWTFYEIDPAVERIARDTRYFTYLSDCAGRCRVVLGDARLSLARAPEHGYDLIVLDAFTSDAIPVHLMTRDAFAGYASRLAAGGAIFVHCSNRSLALAPVLGRIAQSLGLVARVRRDAVPRTAQPAKLPSEWVVMVRSERDLGLLAFDDKWQPVEVPAATPLWTDDFSNLLSVLKLR